MMNKKAFGLIELTLALAISAIVGFIVIRAYSEARQARVAEAAIKEIAMVKSGLNTLYAGHYGKLALEDANLAVSKHLPKTMQPTTQYAASRLLNNQIPLTGNMAMEVINVGFSAVGQGSDGYGFYITFVSDDLCRRLVVADYGRDVRAQGANNIQSATSTGGNPAMTPAEAANACNNENAPTKNLVNVFFR